MEMIEYGPVTLETLVTQKFHRTSVRDEVGNFLYVRWEVEAICNFQPALTSYAPAGLGAIPIPVFGRLPGETDLATLQTLLKPRQLLKVTAGGSVVLETPALVGGVRMPCDSLNGPVCEFVSAPRQIGERHWVVHVRFVAHTNDCPTMINPVLSNVWTSTFDIDEMYYPTRIVAGKAILRTDTMRAGNLNANSFRADFYFPTDVNYVRENVNVKLSEDGATLLWSFMDVGRCYNTSVGASPIRKFDIFRSTISRAGAGGLAVRMVANETQMRLLEVGASGNANAQTIFGTTIRSGASIFRVAQANMPQHNINIRCDIWGDRQSRMSDITRIALGICLNQGIASQVPFSINTAEIICRQELSSRFVSCEISYRWSEQYSSIPLLSDVTIPPSVDGPNAAGGVTMLNSLFLNYSTISARTIPGNVREEVLTQVARQNPIPPNYCQSHGFIEKLIVQAILSPCQPVPRPATLTLAS